MVDVMRQIMSAGATDVQIGAFLLGMRQKGNVIRVAPVPLYNSFEDIVRFVDALKQCLLAEC